MWAVANISECPPCSCPQELRRRKGWGRRGPPVEITSLFSDCKSYTILSAMNLDGFVVQALALIPTP